MGTSLLPPIGGLPGLLDLAASRPRPTSGAGRAKHYGSYRACVVLVKGVIGGGKQKALRPETVFAWVYGFLRLSWYPKTDNPPGGTGDSRDREIGSSIFKIDFQYRGLGPMREQGVAKQLSSRFGSFPLSER